MPSIPPGSGSAYCSRFAAHCWKRRLELVLCLDTCPRPDHWWDCCRLYLQGHLDELRLTPVKYILALDQGTTSSRSIIFDKTGRIKAMAQKEFPQIFPNRDWWSMIPGDLENPARHRQSRPAQGQTHREANCRHRHHQPARNHPALGSRNRAADPSRHRLARPPHGQGLRPPQGGRPRPGHPPQNGSRDRRLFFRHQNCVAAQACESARALARQGRLAFGTIDTWLIWKLTGGTVHVTDASNASRTMLYNLRTGDWDAELLKLFKVPRSVLPEVRGSSEVLGETNLLGGRIPIAGIAGDQQAALFGQCCTRPAW